MSSSDLSQLYEFFNDCTRRAYKGKALAREAHLIDTAFIRHIEFYYPQLAGHGHFSKFKEIIHSKNAKKYFKLKSTGLIYNWLMGTDGKNSEYSFLSALTHHWHSEKKPISNEVLLLSQYLDQKKLVFDAEEKQIYRYFNLPALTFLSSSPSWLMGLSNENLYESDLDPLRMANLNLNSASLNPQDFKGYLETLEKNVISETVKRNLELLSRFESCDITNLKLIIENICHKYKREENSAHLIYDLELYFHVKSLYTVVAYNEMEKHIGDYESGLSDSVQQFMKVHYPHVSSKIYECASQKYSQNRQRVSRITEILLNSGLFKEGNLEKSSLYITHFITSFERYYGIIGNKYAFILLLGQELYFEYSKTKQSEMKSFFEKLSKAITKISVEAGVKLPQLDNPYLNDLMPKEGDSEAQILSKAGEHLYLIHTIKEQLKLVHKDQLIDQLRIDRSDETLLKIFNSAWKILTSEKLSLRLIVDEMKCYQFKGFDFSINDDFLTAHDELMDRSGWTALATGIFAGELSKKEFQDHYREFFWFFIKTFDSITIQNEETKNTLSREDFDNHFDEITSMAIHWLQSAGLQIEDYPKEFRIGIEKIYQEILDLAEELAKAEIKKSA